MLEFLVKLKISLLSAFVISLIYGIVAENDGNLFRIRKCCAENEVILESTGECSEYKLLRVKNHLYQNVNETDEDVNKPGNIDFDASRPWWFPPKAEIISQKTNETLKDFPKEHRIFFGQGPPCVKSETSYLPAYFYKYNFYDDGSILVYPNDEDESQVLMTKMIFDPLSFCIDRLDLDGNLSEEESIEPVLDFSETVDYIVMLCPCIKATCIFKCCQPGMLYDLYNDYDLDSCVRNNRDDWLPIYKKEGKNDPDYFLLHGVPECKPGENIVLPNYSSSDSHGYVIFSNGSAQIEGEAYISKALEFCGENIIDNKENKIHNRILRCYPKNGIKSEWSEIRRILYGLLSAIGAFFLFSTLSIYSYLPFLKKLNDESLIAQTWTLFFGYISLAISQLAEKSISLCFCIFLGFLIQYCFLSAFFWLNVLCFDITYTFSYLRLARGRCIKYNKKKRILYFIYGWISPIIIVFVTAMAEYYPGISNYLLKPEIKERCWFKKGSLAQLAYFHGPIAILLTINFFLYLYTSLKIMQAQNDISATLKDKNPENQRFFLYIKLFLLMGLTWISELISWAVGGPEYYWFIPDIINLLRAVFIFIIICCKKQVIQELKKKICSKQKSNIRRPSNTRSSSALNSSQLGESYKTSNYTTDADSTL